MEAKSGRQVGSENVVRLRAYLTKIDQAGLSLPVAGDGKIDVTAVARACNLDRQVFYKNPEARQILNEAASRYKLEGIVSKVQVDRTDATEDLLDQRDRRIQRLEQELASRQVEVSQLRRELREAREENTRIRLISDHLVETGKRIIP